VVGRELYRVRDGKVAAVPLPGGHAAGVTALLADSTGAVWTGISPAEVLYRFSGEHWDSIALPKPMFVHRIYMDSRQRLMLIGSAGCYRLDESGDWHLLLARTTPKDPMLYGITEARDGSYWISTTAGVVQIWGDKTRHYSRKNGLTDVLIYDLLT